MKKILKCLQWALLACGLAALAYCALVVVETRNLDRAARLELASPVMLQVSAPSNPDLIGNLEIARLGLSVIVMEGTSDATLRRSAGHISGTALPGEVGNAGISAHRDTFFRPLRNIRLDDLITVTTRSAEYRYRVVSTKIVLPARVDVLDPDPDGTELLTLVTCYPFYYLGAAPSRFIVRARRVA